MSSHDLTKTLDHLADLAAGRFVQWLLAGVMLAVALGLLLRVRRRPTRALAYTPGQDSGRAPRAGRFAGQGWLIGIAVTCAAGVAVLGGVRSFEAVSQRFGSALVPLTADGMIVACTALRLAALIRGWRLPGARAITFGFIAGTVWLNIAAAHDVADAVAHALAPLSYAVLVELLAHFLRLHLRLAHSDARAESWRVRYAGLRRLTWLTWLTSPVVTTRVWLHLARTGSDDPVAARALVQQLVRMASRLRAVCPRTGRSPIGWWPFHPARAARTAALQTIRDGLLSAADLATLLPADDRRLSPAELLALVDAAALQRSPLAATTTAHPADGRVVHRGAIEPVSTSAVLPVHHPQMSDRTGARTAAAPTDAAPIAPSAPSEPAPSAPAGRAAGRDQRTDVDLVAALHRHAQAHNRGAALSQREVMRVLGVGTPKAKRLAVLAGWAEPTTANPIPGRPLHVVHQRTDEQPNPAQPAVHDTEPDPQTEDPDQVDDPEAKTSR